MKLFLILLSLLSGYTQQHLVCWALTLRSVKGSELTYSEMDNNWTGLSDGSFWAATVTASSTTLSVNTLAVTTGDITTATGVLDSTSVTSPPGVVLRGKTSDGSDTGFTLLQGGGALSDSRGAQMSVAGNEHASLPGTAQIVIGNVTGGHLRVYCEGQILMRFVKNSTSKTWRIQTDIDNTDDFGIYNETQSQAVMSVAAGSAGQVLFGVGRRVVVGMLGVNSEAGTPGATIGNVGVHSAAGIQIIGNGATNDITLYNKSGNAALTVATGTTNVAIVGALSKGSGSFDITHPLNSALRLRHSFIEGPRYDLIYRGRANVVGGTAVVNIDAECNGGSGMTAGTFEALTRNPEVWLNTTHNYSLSGATLTITGADGPVGWMIIAERKDEHIMSGDTGWNDINGNMLCEYTEQSLKDYHASKLAKDPAPEILAADAVIAARVLEDVETKTGRGNLMFSTNQ